MIVIDKHKLTEIYKLKEGEVFESSGLFWFVSDYVDINDNTLCIDLESGHAQFFCADYVVTPVTAEVHML